MCTVSWFRSDGGYHLFFNRDERRTRAPAAPPTERSAAGVRFLAPRDPEAGGGWIAVNECGLTLGILNYYEQEGRHAPARRSRGLLLLDLAVMPDPEAVASRLPRMSLRDYAPFHLLALNRDEDRLWTWNGAHLIVGGPVPEPCLMTTSSVRPTEVFAARRRAYAATIGQPPPDARRLAEFHRQHDPERAEESVCMERPDARTVSLSEIVVGEDSAVFRYYPRPPDAMGFDAPVEARLAARWH